MTPLSSPAAATANLITFRRLLRENQDSLLSPPPADIPVQLYSALDDIESAVVRERARVLFGEIVAARRAGAVDLGARARTRRWFERLLSYVEAPKVSAPAAVAS